jgi:hypothetical protein
LVPGSYPGWLSLEILICPGHSAVCPGHTLICPGGSIICPGGSVDPCGGSFFEQPQTIGPEDISALKADLKQALSAIEEEERMASESLRPQSLEEVTQLEQKLQGALREVQSRKEELTKKQK